MSEPCKTPIVMKLEQNRKVMNERVGVGQSFDIGFRTLHLLNHEVNLYYVTGLCETPIIVELMRQLFEMNEFESESEMRSVFSADQR